MNKTCITWGAVVGLSAGVLLGQESFKPLSYQVVTQFVRYERTSYEARTNDSRSIIHMESTNWPSAITHSVTWGQGTNPVFVLRSCQVLPTLPETNGWYNAEWIHFQSWTWIEAVK